MAKRKAGGGVSFTVEGAKQLERALARVGVGARTRVLRRGMRLGMDVVTELARAYAPVRTGKLRMSLETVNGRTNSKWKVRVETRAGKGHYKGDTYYAAFIEFGTKRLPARPFLAPARDSGRARAVTVARDAILEGVEAEVRAAAFRKTTIGRAATRASKAATRANRATRRAAKRARKVARKASRATTRAARRTSRRARGVGRRALKSARRSGKAFRKGAVKRARKAEKSLARREKAIAKRIRKAIKPRRRRRRK